jgi:hypothetical protein
VGAVTELQPGSVSPGICAKAYMAGSPWVLKVRPKQMGPITRWLCHGVVLAAKQGAQPSSTMPLQLSSKPLLHTSVRGTVAPPHAPQAVASPAPRTQVCVPGRHSPTPSVPAGPS